MSCPNLEADVSPRSMVSFSRKWYFKITVWVLGTLIGTGWSLCLGFLREQRSILIAAVQTQDNQLRLLFYVSTFFCVNSSGSKHKGDVELEYFLIIHLLFVLVESHYSSLSNESRYSLVRYWMQFCACLLALPPLELEMYPHQEVTCPLLWQSSDIGCSSECVLTVAPLLLCLVSLVIADQQCLSAHSLLHVLLHTSLFLSVLTMSLCKSLMGEQSLY